MMSPAHKIATGGVLAALAVMIMALGGLIPLATFLCPMICMLLLKTVVRLCGRRIGWAWFGAVALLVVLLSPDKEAAFLFLFLGYYPLIKPQLDRFRLAPAVKLLFFNSVIAILYWFLLQLLGLGDLILEYETMGTALVVVTILLGNVVFFLMDRLLERWK